MSRSLQVIGSIESAGNFGPIIPVPRPPSARSTLHIMVVAGASSPQHSFYQARNLCPETLPYLNPAHSTKQLLVFIRPSSFLRLCDLHPSFQPNVDYFVPPSVHSHPAPSSPDSTLGLQARHHSDSVQKRAGRLQLPGSPILSVSSDYRTRNRACPPFPRLRPCGSWARAAPEVHFEGEANAPIASSPPDLRTTQSKGRCRWLPDRQDIESASARQPKPIALADLLSLRLQFPFS